MAPSRDPPCILVVDDDREVLDVICRMLEDAGYAVTKARNGLAAIAQLETECPDLLITDNRMPGITGDALIAEARVRFPELAILRLSGDGAPGRADVTTLYKPFQPHELVQTVRQLLPV